MKTKIANASFAIVDLCFGPAICIFGKEDFPEKISESFASLKETVGFKKPIGFILNRVSVPAVKSF